MQRIGKADDGRYKAQTRRGRSATHFRKYELDGERAEPSRPNTEFHSYGIGAATPDRTLSPLLAADGGRLRPGSIWNPFRWFYAALSYRQNRRNPEYQRRLRGIQEAF